MEKRIGIGLVIMVLAFSALASVVFAAGGPVSEWELVDVKSVPELPMVTLQNSIEESRVMEPQQKDAILAAFEPVVSEPRAGMHYKNVRLTYAATGNVEVSNFALYARKPDGLLYQVSPTKSTPDDDGPIKAVDFLQEEAFKALEAKRALVQIRGDFQGLGILAYKVTLEAIGPSGASLEVTALRGQIEFKEPLLEVDQLKVPSAGSPVEPGWSVVAESFSAGPSFGEVVIDEIHGRVEIEGSAEVRDFRLMVGEETIGTIAVPVSGEFAFLDVPAQTTQHEEFNIRAEFAGRGRVTVRITEIRAFSATSGQYVKVVGDMPMTTEWEVRPREAAVSLSAASPFGEISEGDQQTVLVLDAAVTWGSQLKSFDLLLDQGQFLGVNQGHLYDGATLVRSFPITGERTDVQLDSPGIVLPELAKRALQIKLDLNGRGPLQVGVDDVEILSGPGGVIPVNGVPVQGHELEVSGEITWEVPAEYDLETALDNAISGEEIRLAEGWYELPHPPVDPDPAEDLLVAGKGPSNTLLLGQLRLEEGSTLQGFSLFNDQEYERQGEGFKYTESAALRTRGSVTIRDMVVSGPNAWVSMGSSSRGWDVQSQILVEDSIFIGKKTGEFVSRAGLSLDVYHTVDLENPVVHNNVFIGTQCGIDLSIDVVFSDIPTNDGRLEAFEEYAAALETANTFVNVDQPVCGAKG